MKKTITYLIRGKLNYPQGLSKMKFILLFAFILHLAMGVYAQPPQFNIKLENASLKQVFDQITEQSDYSFVYGNIDIKNFKGISINVKNASVQEVLQECLKGLDLEYEIHNKVIILRKAKKQVPSVKKGKGNNISIHGKITDEEGVPLPGATVIINGTNKGITTNDDGQFVLAVPSETTILRVSFIGFETKMIKVGEQRDFAITLNETTTNLGEVVVTGYQTLPKERVTGSFSTVGEAELKMAGSNFNLKDRLEDLIPGLFFEPNYDDDPYGSEDDSKSIVIRGISTFGDKNPLVVIDGFAMDPTISDPWTSVNPDDVESVTVLKDAAAASIWGAQAANGVIVIKTKKSNIKTQKPTYSLSLDFVTKPKPNLSKIPWASSEDAAEIYKWMILDHDWFDNLLTTYYDKYDLPDIIRTLIDIKAGNITEDAGNAKFEELSHLDVRDEFSDLFLRPETQRKANLSIQSGGKYHKTRTSITATLNDLYAKKNSDSKFMANINDDYTPAEWLKFSVGVNFSLEENKKNGVEIGDLNYITQHSRILDDNGDYLPMIREYSVHDRFYDFSTAQRRDTAEKYGLPYDWDWNLKRDMDNMDNTTKTTNLRLNAKMILKPIKPLSVELSYQYIRKHRLERQYYNEESWQVRNSVNYYAQPDGTYPIPLGGQLFERRTSTYSHAARLQFIYNKTIGDHAIKVLGGTEWKKDYYERIPYGLYGYDPQSLTYNTSIDFTSSYTMINGENPSYPTIAVLPGTFYYTGLSGKDRRYVSYYGNLGYTYKKRYDLTASIRVDKTNLYGQSSDYRDLPQWSVGFGWTISKEPFFKDVKHIDNLRLRASYGFNGFIDKSASPYIKGYSNIDPVTQLPFSAVTTAPNPDLTWEKTKVFNMGTDFALFKNKVKGSLEYYSKRTSNVLVSTAVNGTYGFQNNKATVNAGDIKNTGVELNLSSPIINNKDFTWRSTFNLGANKNMTDGYTRNATYWSYYLMSSYAYHVDGQSVSYMAAMRWAGYDENGMPQFYYGKNTIYSAADSPSWTTLDADSVLTFVGQRDPKIYGALTNSFTYKNFELTIRLSYKFGHKFWDDYPPTYIMTQYLNSNKYFTWLPGIMVNRWQSPEDAETASMFSMNEKITNGTFNYITNLLEHYNDRKALNAGNIRIQSINLAYRIPVSSVKWIKSAIIRFEARNLGAIWVANSKGIDPENPPYSSSKYSALNYVVRNRPEFSVGLKLDF